jgi:predicted transcriptional regulator
LDRPAAPGRSHNQFLPSARACTTIGGKFFIQGDAMDVRDLIKSRNKIFSVSEEMTVHESACYLRENQLRAVGVLNAGGKLVGVLSQSDISDKVAAENKCPAWMRVAEIMSRDLIVVGLELTIDECLRRMEKHGIFHLLVMDSEGAFYGMISVADLLQVIASDHKARADLLEALIFPQR